MNKKILIVSSSYRKNGNSETLAKEFERGAKEAGNSVETIYLRDYEINYCRGCLACQTTGKCIINDEVKEIIEKVKDAEILVFATPIYYYSVSGQLKTFLDRMNPLYIQNFKYREVYLITAAADENEEKANEGAIKAVEGWVECFNGVSLKDSMCGTNTTTIGDIKDNAELLNRAYEMGKNV